MGYCVYVFLLCIFYLFNTLSAGIYYEDKINEDTILRRCRPDLSCFPSELEWAELEDSMTGTLVWRDDKSNYTAFNSQYNFRTRTFPIVHVVCKNVEDIQKAVRFAKKHNLRVTIKSTGSEQWGRSSAHGSFSINLREMKYMSVNPEATPRSEHGEVTVETGVTSRVLYEEVEKHGRLIVAGNCKIVGPAGYLGGGGIGRFNPAFGLGLDNVLEIKVVLADGRVATCTPDKTVIEDNSTSETIHNGKLFWALRGGGGGAFGVVVHYVIKLHVAPSTFVSGRLRGSLYQNESDIHMLKTHLEVYEEWARSAPNHWGAGLVVFKGGIYVIFAKLGPWDNMTESEIRPLLNLKSHYDQRISINLANLTSSADLVVGDGATNSRSYGTGALISNTTGLWDFLIQSTMDHTARNMSVYYSLSRLGGKVAEYDVTSSSVHAGFRRAQFNLGYSFSLTKNYELSTIEHQEWVKQHVAQFAEKLRKFQDGQYINNGYGASPNWKEDFWGDHYADLLKVKNHYDPDNFFTCLHCVGSDKTYKDDETTDSSATVTEKFTNISLLLISVIMSMC